MNRFVVGLRSRSFLRAAAFLMGPFAPGASGMVLKNDAGNMVVMGEPLRVMVMEEVEKFRVHLCLAIQFVPIIMSTPAVISSMTIMH
jgi:hypothetical protein